jgi:hypothetical protein
MDTSSRPTPRAGREPSWPRVLANTVQLWLTRRRWRGVYVIMLLLVVALGAGLGTALAVGTSGRAGQARAVSRAPRPPVAATRAADWVAGQVSHQTTVACDPAMCELLQHRGFPASNLDLVRAGTSAAPGASLVVATAALRGDLGRRIAAAYAPVALASFGTGTDRIEILAAAPDGPAAYLTSLRADLATRRSVGAQLLRGHDVQADPLARTQLTEGRPDSRLIATIGMMAALHPLHLVAFGDASPGAGPGVPLRSVLLYGDTHGVAAGTALLASLRAFLVAQQSLYRPASIQAERLGAGRSALHIVFAAPGPLGLLDASQPLVKISSP